MTAKRFLEQAFRLDRRIERRVDEIARLRARLTKATAQLTGMPRGGSGGDWTELDVKVLAEEARIKAEIAELCRVKREIAEAIDAVEDKRYRDLLEYRYRFFMKWEEIAKEMNYSGDWLRHMHRQALDAVKVPETRHTKTH